MDGLSDLAVGNIAFRTTGMSKDQRQAYDTFTGRNRDHVRAGGLTYFRKGDRFTHLPNGKIRDSVDRKLGYSKWTVQAYIYDLIKGGYTADDINSVLNSRSDTKNTFKVDPISGKAMVKIKDKWEVLREASEWGGLRFGDDDGEGNYTTAIQSLRDMGEAMGTGSLKIGRLITGEARQSRAGLSSIFGTDLGTQDFRNYLSNALNDGVSSSREKLFKSIISGRASVSSVLSERELITMLTDIQTTEGDSRNFSVEKATKIAQEAASDPSKLSSFMQSRMSNGTLNETTQQIVALAMARREQSSLEAAGLAVRGHFKNNPIYVEEVGK
jgi:hypothetical protein